jgi:huntingtin
MSPKKYEKALIQTTLELSTYLYSRNLSEFGKLIAVSIETLLSFCDDEEPDVRLVAGDCVNRIIKVGCMMFHIFHCSSDRHHL